MSLRLIHRGRRLILDQFGRSVAHGGARALSSSSQPYSVTPLPLSTELFPPLQSLTSKPPTLWLLVHSASLDRDPNFGDHYPYSFVSLKDEKIYKLDKTQVPSQRRLPWDRAFFFPDDTEIHGTTSFGWILTVHQHSLKMFLVNPLFPSDCIVPLPPLLLSDHKIVAGSVSKPENWYYTNNNNPRLLTRYISWEKDDPDRNDIDDSDTDTETLYKGYNPSSSLYTISLAMSSPPSDPNCTVLLQRFGCLHFWKPGRNSWLRLNEPDEFYAGQSLVYSKAAQCFYVLYDFYDVDAWEWASSSSEPRRMARIKTRCPPRPLLETGEEAQMYEKCRNTYSPYRYLVESDSGDLLMVLRYIEPVRLHRERTVQFYVFKLEQQSDKKSPKWEPIRCLGSGSESSALLVGRRYAFCVRTKEYPELKPNCIYYAGNLYLPRNDEDEVEDVEPGDMQVFDMEDNVIKYYRFSSLREGFPAVWLFPNVNP